MAFENQLKSLQGATQYSSPSNSAASQGKIPIKSRLRGFGHTTDHYESRATNERRYPRGGASPYIKLSSAHNDILREAKCWLTYAFMMPSENFTILNGFIQHFGQREFDKLLSLQTKWNVSIKEFFKDGRAGVIIQGSSRGVRASVLELEAIFCKVQEDFAKKEESDMGLKSSNNFSRTPVENNSSDDFSGLEIVRVEKVENSTLKHLFELKKRQLQSASSQRMYQRLPAQYCDLVSRVGFQREFAPPDEQNHGEGIYFSSSVHGTEKLWRGLADEEYLYFFAAQVLTGKSTIGTPGLIVPPETPGGDPLTLYDSVEGGVNTCHFQWSPGPT
ncbi:protein mono-ADP-ribosyltransferase PARP9 isoform X3 [Oncorhynchus mykiss]|uniref:protein mono-ADP-ribosyltransferase PARP9 isoform X3 n=1 Tax=Oncorhynchus mykiss TaxID=8022 RepID=UPI000B4FA7C6|nr:protein mono-ADP-ribosyltransferase PARP9 isoform X3 [Oncorhynchus mykiss]